MCISSDLGATHIIGSTLRCSHLGNFRYALELRLVRDCYFGVPGTELEPNAHIAIYGPQNQLYVGAGPLTLPLSDVEFITFSPDTTCIELQNVCIESGVYRDTFQLPSDLTGWKFVYQRCCRSHILQNVYDPLNTGLTLTAPVLSAEINQAPEVSADLIKISIVNAPFVHDLGVMDPDGDSLVYSLVTPFTGASNDNALPVIPSHPPYDTIIWISPPYSRDNMLGGPFQLMIDPHTGVMTAIPTLLGIFQAAYRIHEYRDGVLINEMTEEFIIVITPGLDVNFRFSGSVIAGTTGLDFGEALLLERDLNEDTLRIHSTQTISNGYYEFIDIPRGAFLLNATPYPSTATYAQYAPTYWPESLFWYDAFAMPQCQAPEIEIRLKPMSLSSQGIYALTGVIDQVRSSDPVQDVTVFLMYGDSIAGYSKTDPDGNFAFENIAHGAYELHIDAINTNVYNTEPPAFQLTDTMHLTCRLHDTYLEIIDGTTSVATQIQDELYYISSNGSRVFFNSKGQEHSELVLNVFDILGRLVSQTRFNTSAQREQLPFRDHPTGLYIVQAIEQHSNRTVFTGSIFKAN